jgi:predicted phosphodiesterase
MNKSVLQQANGLALSSVPSLEAAAAAGLLVAPGRLTIGLMSDLHTEAGLPPEDVPCPDVDVWVAAGDIATQRSNQSSVEWLKAFSRRSIQEHSHVAPVLFVPGNHDFYRGVVPQARARWKKESQGSAVHVMDNDELVLAGVRFLGTPLWSNFSGVAALLRPHVARSAERNISDFFVIESAPGVRWTTADLVREHDRAYQFLADRLGVPYAEDGLTGVEFISSESAAYRRLYQQEMVLGGHDSTDSTLRVFQDLPREAPARPAAPLSRASASSAVRAQEGDFARSVAEHGLSVVLTHWAPHLKANHPMFVGGDLSSYFVNHHPELCRAANLWLFGHTHTLSDFVVDDGPEDRAQVEQSLIVQRDAWRDQDGLNGPMAHEPLFDPLPIREAACWGRTIAHPRGYPKEHVPGLGPSVYAPLVLSLFPDGHTERSDRR